MTITFFLALFGAMMGWLIPEFFALIAKRGVPMLWNIIWSIGFGLILVAGLGKP